jgi:hypothetical protein
VRLRQIKCARRKRIIKNTQRNPPLKPRVTRYLGTFGYRNINWMIGEE